jgi:hypothetical protein
MLVIKLTVLFDNATVAERIVFKPPRRVRDQLHFGGGETIQDRQIG